MTPWLADADLQMYHGDALEVLRQLEDSSADACVTSPPYLDARREYTSPSLPTFEAIFQELARVVAGPILLNVGRLFRDHREVLWWADLLQRADWAGWPLTDTLVWFKPNGNPIRGEVLADSHEYVFLLGEGFNPDAVRTPYADESKARLARSWINGSGVKGDGPARHRVGSTNPRGARPRSVVAITTGQEKGNPHPAPMPLELATHLIKLSGGSRILDPFAGSGTTLVAARKLGLRAVGIDKSEDYLEISAGRLGQQSLLADRPDVLIDVPGLMLYDNGVFVFSEDAP